MARNYSPFTLIAADGSPLRGDDVLDDLKQLAPAGSTIINRTGTVLWTAPSEEEDE